MKIEKLESELQVGTCSGITQPVVGTCSGVTQPVVGTCSGVTEPNKESQPSTAIAPLVGF